jgi:hypothetical protein
MDEQVKFIIATILAIIVICGAVIAAGCIGVSDRGPVAPIDPNTTVIPEPIPEQTVEIGEVSTTDPATPASTPLSLPKAESSEKNAVKETRHVHDTEKSTGNPETTGEPKVTPTELPNPEPEPSPDPEPTVTLKPTQPIPPTPKQTPEIETHTEYITTTDPPHYVTVDRERGTAKVHGEYNADYKEIINEYTELFQERYYDREGWTDRDGKVSTFGFRRLDGTRPLYDEDFILDEVRLEFYDDDLQLYCTSVITGMGEDGVTYVYTELEPESTPYPTETLPPTPTTEPIEELEPTSEEGLKPGGTDPYPTEYVLDTPDGATHHMFLNRKINTCTIYAYYWIPLSPEDTETYEGPEVEFKEKAGELAAYYQEYYFATTTPEVDNGLITPYKFTPIIDGERSSEYSVDKYYLITEVTLEFYNWEYQMYGECRITGAEASDTKWNIGGKLRYWDFPGR